MVRVAAKMFLAVAALALPPLWGRVVARAARAPQCPRVSVTCPEVGVAGEPATFTVTVAGGVVTSKLTFNWVVSAGTITSGQGEPTVVVDSTGVEGTAVEATVEVGGLPALCPKSATCATGVPPRCGGVPKIDEYGNISYEDEQRRLDNLAVELQNNPSAQGYLITYGGRRGHAGEAQRRADRAKDYLVNTRGIPADRIVTVDGGFREDLTVELWLIHSGASPPTGSPTVDPTEVEIIPEEP